MTSNFSPQNSLCKKKKITVFLSIYRLYHPNWQQVKLLNIYQRDIFNLCDSNIERWSIWSPRVCCHLICHLVTIFLLSPCLLICPRIQSTASVSQGNSGVLPKTHVTPIGHRTIYVFLCHTGAHRTQIHIYHKTFLFEVCEGSQA